MARRSSTDRPSERGGLWIGLCQTIMYPAAFLLGRERVSGGEHLRRPGGYLVVANHISHLDPLYDAVIMKKHGRIPRFMAKASLWKVPVLGSALRGTAQIPVERGPRGAGQASLTAATDALAAGQVVLIYPDGTVTKDPDRWPMRPRPGVASLALAGDFPVIPLAQWGTHAVYDSYAQGRKFRPWPRRNIVVKVGPPIDLTELRSRPVDARTTLEATLLIMGAVRDLLAEVRGEAAPKNWYDPKKGAARPATSTGDGSGRPGAADQDGAAR